MYCKYCGQQIDDNAQFCPYCGKKMKDRNDSHFNKSRKRQSNKRFPGKALWIALALIVSAISIGLTYRFISNKSFNNEAYAFYEPVDSAKIRYEQGERFIEGHLLLTAREGTKFKDIETLVNNNGGVIIGYIPVSDDYQILFETIKDYAGLGALITILEQERIVESVTLENVFEVNSGAIDYEKDPWIPSADSSISPSWNEIPFGSNWWTVAIMMPEVWQLNYEFKDVKVGLIDSFFDIDNDDLRDAFEPNGVIGQDQLDIAALYQRAVSEEKKGNKPSTSSSEYAHGTHTAGIIGARNNDYGICGISQNAKLFGVSLYGNDEKWNCSSMSFKYAIATLLDKGVRIINISMGLEDLCFAANMEAAGNDTRTKAALDDLKQASLSLSVFLKKCLKHYDFLIVKSAGNTSGYEYVEVGIDKDHPYGYRRLEESDSLVTMLTSKKMNCSAEYDIFGAATDEEVRKHIIVVGAVDYKSYFTGFFDDNSSQGIVAAEEGLPDYMNSQNKLQEFMEAQKVTPQIRAFYSISDFSNTGKRVDLYAPGGTKQGSYGGSAVKVLSDFPNGEIGLMRGTSQAAPMVAGVMALIWGVDTDLTSIEVRDILLSAADDQNGLKTVNALKSVEAVTGHDPKYDRTLEEASFFMGITYETVVDNNGNTQDHIVISNIEIQDETGNKTGNIQTFENEFNADLAPGTYQVILTAAGYKTIKDTIVIEKGKTLFRAYKMIAGSGEIKWGESSYSEVIDALEKEYGPLELNIYESESEQAQVAEANGLCYLELIDFNNDGVEELLAVVKHENDPEYTVIVYTDKNNQAVQLISIKLEDRDPFGNYLFLLNDENGNTYIDKCQWTGEWDYDEIYGYDNNEFKQISISCRRYNFYKDPVGWDYYIADEVPEEVIPYSPIGKLVSFDVYEKEAPLATGARGTELDDICLRASEVGSGSFWSLDIEALQASIDKVKDELTGSDN